MIEIEYLRDDSVRRGALFERLTVDAEGNAKLVSRSNTRQPGLGEIGIYGRKLTKEEHEALGRDLSPARLAKTTGQRGQVGADSPMRLLGVREGKERGGCFALVQQEPDELQPFFHAIDSLAAILRNSPVRAVHLDWGDWKVGGDGTVLGTLTLSNVGLSEVKLRLPGKDAGSPTWRLDAVPADSAIAVRTDLQLEGADGSSLTLAAGDDRTFNFKAPAALKGSGAFFCRLFCEDPRAYQGPPQPGDDGPELAGVLVTSAVELRIGAEAPQPGPVAPVTDPGCPGLDTPPVETVRGQAKVADSTDGENFARCIQNPLAPAPFLLTMPVRDLTRTDAIRIVVWLVQQGRIKPDPQIRFDSNCKLLFPVPGNKITISPDILTTAGTVLWRRITTFPPTTRAAEPLRMDPRGIVLLWRASTFLAEEFGADTVLHPHFIDGRQPNDCHDEGRAVDFSGLEGTFPDPFPRSPALAGRDYSVTVFSDWGQRPTPPGTGLPHPKYRLEADKTLDFAAEPDPKKSAALEKRRAAAVIFGPFYDEWVAPNSSDRDVTKVAYDPATGASTGVYDPRTGKVTAGADPNLPSSTVGETQGFAIGPDYRDEPQKLRGQHDNHIHFQVSTTGHEPFPPG